MKRDEALRPALSVNDYRHPILARSRQPLAAGLHTFRLYWRIPKDNPGASLFLISAWSTHQPSQSVAQAIAELALN